VLALWRGIEPSVEHVRQKLLKSESRYPGARRMQCRAHSEVDAEYLEGEKAALSDDCSGAVLILEVGPVKVGGAIEE